jgi:hypothetical protein
MTDLLNRRPCPAHTDIERIVKNSLRICPEVETYGDLVGSNVNVKITINFERHERQRKD